MSILINGMEMPKDEAVALYIYPDRRAKLWRPQAAVSHEFEAVPVPPHGRLGDLDELKVKIKKEDSGYELSSFGDGMWTAFQSVYRCIDTAPTIIPASE